MVAFLKKSQANRSSIKLQAGWWDGNTASQRFDLDERGNVETNWMEFSHLFLHEFLLRQTEIGLLLITPLKIFSSFLIVILKQFFQTTDVFYNKRSDPSVRRNVVRYRRPSVFLPDVTNELSGRSDLRSNEVSFPIDEVVPGSNDLPNHWSKSIGSRFGSARRLIVQPVVSATTLRNSTPERSADRWRWLAVDSVGENWKKWEIDRLKGNKRRNSSLMQCTTRHTKLSLPRLCHLQS